MRKLNASIQFMVPTEIKERFWALSSKLGLLPSQIMREALLRELDRLERLEAKQDTNTREKGGETK